MKTLLLFVCLFLTSLGYSQEFLGIKVDGNRDEVIQKFIQKGFVMKPRGSESPTVSTLTGTYSGKFFEINIVNTPKTKKVWKFAVYLPEKTNWYSLKSDYEDYLATLTKKYGEPNKSYSFFSSPYYEGDGYEMSALKLEKCHYVSFWDNMSVEISKWSQVKITYQNMVNSQLNDQENEQLNKNIF
jgi:hypothetical protein